MVNDIRYCISVGTYQAMVSDQSERAILSILGQNGFPTRLESDGEDWLYRSDRELNPETLRDLNAIPGVSVRRMGQSP